MSLSYVAWAKNMPHRDLELIDMFSSSSRYFFFVLTALIVLGLFNGLVFLPVLLVMLGPPAEVVPADHSDRISPPTPELPPANLNRKRGSSTRSASHGSSFRITPSPMTSLTAAKRHNSDISLSTIAEESNSYSSSGSSHSYCCAAKTPECSRRHHSAPMASLSGASVFVEPHVTVETTTYVSLQFSLLALLQPVDRFTWANDL